MTDEVKEGGNSPVTLTEVAELSPAGELSHARLNELEQTLASKEGELAILKQTTLEMEKRLTNLSNSLAEAIASYKALVIQANPEVPPELVTGDAIPAVNESLSKAKNLVSRVRQRVEDEISLTRIPAGAPGRTSPDFSALSPREKIQYAITGRTT